MSRIVPRFTHSLTAVPLFCIVFVLSLFSAIPAEAQEDSKKSKSNQKVIIEREPLRVLAPEVYLHRFQLKPIQTLKVNAPMNGTVAQISVKRGDSVGHQQQLIRMDDRELLLQVEIAAQSSSSTAKLEQQLAQLRLERSKLLAPFAGKIERLHVPENSFVVAGTTLITLVDDSSLQVTIPMERSAVNVGDEIELDVEGESYPAQVTYVGPLDIKWDTLRDLSKSVAAVTCQINNSEKKVHVGQTVQSPLVPRYPVVEVPIDTLENGEQGGRTVQILRDRTVRVLNVKTLGQVGEERVFVSGMFAPGDELITKSSIPLAPGTVVQSSTAKPEKKSSWSSTSSSQKSKKSKSPTF